MNSENSTIEQQNEVLESRISILERLEHFSVYSDRLIVVIGKPGSGKTTMLKNLKDSLEPHINSFYSDCDNDQWFGKLLEQQGIRSTAAAKSFQFGLGQVNPHKETLWILDNGNSLQIEQLELVIDKVQDENFHCIISLSDNSALLKWLKEYPENVILISLPAFTHQEIIDLACQRLDLDQDKLNSMIDSKLIKTWLLETDSDPDQISSLVEKIRSVSMQKRDFMGPWSFNKMAMSMIAFLLAVVLIMIFVFKDSLVDYFGNESQMATIKQQINEKEKPSETGLTDDMPRAIVDRNESENYSNSIKTEPDETDEMLSLETSVENRLPEKEHLEQNSELIKNELRLDQPRDNSNIKILSENTNQMSSLVSDEMDNAKIEDNLDERFDVLLSPDKNNTKTPLPVLNQPRDNAMKTNNNAIASNVNQKKTDGLNSAQGFTQQEMSLLNYSQSVWMIQLAGFSEIGNAIEFVSEIRPLGEIHYYRTQRGNNDWFVVVMGPYTSKEDAKVQIANFTDVLKQKQPWLKSMLQIHQEIRSRQQ